MHETGTQIKKEQECDLSHISSEEERCPHRIYDCGQQPKLSKGKGKEKLLATYTEPVNHVLETYAP